MKRIGYGRKSGILDIHKYRIRVIEDRVFNQGLDISDAFSRVILDIITHLRGQIKYNEYEVRFTFTFNDGARNEFYVNIPFKKIVRNDNIVPYLCERLEAAFQSGDQYTFSDFIIEVKVVHNPKGNGV